MRMTCSYSLIRHELTQVTDIETLGLHLQLAHVHPGEDRARPHHGEMKDGHSFLLVDKKGGHLFKAAGCPIMESIF